MKLFLVINTVISVIFLSSLSIAKIDGKRPCREFRESFCSGKMGPALKQCMKDNESKMPEECKKAMEKLKDTAQACKEDIKSLCPDIKPGGGRVMVCLRGKLSDIKNEECKSAIEKAKP